MTRLRTLLATIRLPAISVLVALFVGAIVIMLSDLEVLGKIPQDPIGAIVLGEPIAPRTVLAAAVIVVAVAIIVTARGRPGEPDAAEVVLAEAEGAGGATARR